MYVFLRRLNTDSKAKLAKRVNHISTNITEMSAKPRLVCRSEIDAMCEAPSVGYVAFLVTLACSAAIIHRQYLASMFENDRHFSHLSTLERELTFRTEMGFYYSYYKTLVEASSFWNGIEAIVNDNVTEYPLSINSLNRFNIYPEVFIAAGYRTTMKAMELLGLPTKQCWHVKRGNGLSAIVSCEGIGEPAYFYVESVFFLNGVLVAVLFLFGVYLSGSVLGGILSVLCFFFNHTECTRVQWTPALRESFAYPFCLLQMFVVSVIIRSRNAGLVECAVLAYTTLCFMLPWQFAQFALLTQVMSIFGLYMVRHLSARKVKVIATALLVAAFVQSVLMFGNRMIIASYLVASCLTALLMTSAETRIQEVKCRVIVEAGAMLLGTVSIKSLFSWVLQVSDDAHIVHLLLSKFTSFRTFDTMLYTCAAEYDFLPLQTLVAVSKTFLLPMAMVSVAMVLLLVFQSWKTEKTSIKPDNQTNVDDRIPLCIQSCLLYHVFQLTAFSVMALLIMRLKLFWTPHLCLVSSLLGSPLLLRWFGSRTRHQLVLTVVVAMAAVQGIKNISDDQAILGEFSSIDTERLVEWITKNTEENAVFAGSMPTMATVKLCTHRPIVNHPHYEDAGLRTRTKKVYSLFSRKSEEEVWQNLMDLGVDFVINEQSWCTGKSRIGCGLAEIWDTEDEANVGKSRTCERLHEKPEPYFRNVFRSHVFDVLEIVKNPDLATSSS